MELFIALIGFLIISYISFKHPDISISLLVSIETFSLIIESLFGYNSPIISRAGIFITLLVVIKYGFNNILQILVKSKIIRYSFFFLVWFIITNPESSLLYDTNAERLWAFTFIQLIALAVLAGMVFNKDESRMKVLFIFSLFSLISGLIPFLQSGFIIGQTRMETINFAGLTGGANTAVRNYIISIIFMAYFLISKKGYYIKIFSVISILLLIIFSIITFSRAGLILLTFCFMSFFIKVLKREYIPHLLLFLLITLVILIVFMQTQFWDLIILSLFRGADYNILYGAKDIYSSVYYNIRWDLLFSGLKMFAGSPIYGVGIGEYSMSVGDYLPYYIPEKYTYLGAHNMYIQVLAETGLIGFILFIMVMVKCFQYLIIAMRSKHNDNNIAYIIFTAFSVILIGGFFKHDHYIKILWFLIGMCVSYEVAPKKRLHPF